MAKLNGKKQKILQFAAVGVISVGIILAGAFAWTSFTQSAVNIFEGFTNPDVNLHDDYAKGEQNKDVYVENSGQRPLYVRVMLSEYMQIDNRSLIDGGSIGDYDSWSPHSYLGTTVDNCGEAPHDYYDWVMGNQAGDPNKGFKYYLPAPFANRALFDEAGEQTRDPTVVYYEEEEDGSYKTQYGKNSSYDLESLYDAYARIDTILASSGTTPGETLNDELQALYAVLDAAVDSAARRAAQITIDTFLTTHELGYWDEIFEVDETGLVVETSSEVTFIPLKRTGTTVKLYTMAQWIAAGTPTGDFWILDVDGWAYWGNILMPGQSTGLLLSEVILNELNMPAGVWWYGINAQLQAVTYNDIAAFADKEGAEGGGGITDQGMMVLQAVSGEYVFDMKPGAVVPNEPVYTFQNCGGNVYRLMTTDGANTITYGPHFIYTGAVPVTTKGDIYKQGNNSGDAYYLIGKTFKKDIPFGQTGVTFTIVNAGNGSSIVESKDGKYYIKLSYTNAAGVANQTAWLAVGADKKFDAITRTGTNPSYNYLSDGDDILVWTTEAYPGLNPNNDRQVEEAGQSYKINDSFNKDGIDWVIIGKDSKTGSPTDGKTLIISRDVLMAGVATESGIAASLTSYMTTNSASLTSLTTADSTITPITLKIQDAIDYFPNNAARVAAFEGSSSDWWLTDGVVGTNGALGALDDGSHGLRVAFWIKSDKLQDLLYPTPAP